MARAKSIDTILGALPALKPAELQVIQAACTALLGPKAAKATQRPNTPEAWLYEALQAVLSATHGVMGFASKHLDKNSPDAIAFMNKVFGKYMTNRTTALAVMKCVLWLLMDDLKKRKIPISPKTIAVHLPRLSEVWENSYPGYVQSGLVDLVVKPMMKRT